MEKCWKNESRHDTFESADHRRKKLLEKKTEGLLVKVKLMRSDNRFVVKTWTPPARPKSDQKKTQGQKGRLKTRAQRRALRERRKKERESTN